MRGTPPFSIQFYLAVKTALSRDCLSWRHPLNGIIAALDISYKRSGTLELLNEDF